MASAFIGLTVNVLLTSGTSLKGHVANVDPNTQRLMLQDVVIKYAGEKTARVLPSFSVAGGEIKDLQVLPTQPAVHPPHHAAASPAVSATLTSTTTATSNFPQQKQQQHQQHNPHAHLQHEQHIHAPLVAPSPRQLPAHPQPNPPATPSVPYHDPAIISFKPSLTPKHTQQFNDSEALVEKTNSMRIGKAQQYHNDNVAESSAAESVSRGPRRARRSNHSHHHTSSNGNNNYHSNNNMSDYGSPRTGHQSISSKRTSRRYKEPVHEWAQADTEEFKDQDFDFQGNLGLFDKARVFAEIREADDTAPESLLVNLNRNPNRARAIDESPMLRKLLPTENVLDPAPKRSQYKRTNSKDNVHGSGLSEEDEVDDSDDDDSWNSSSVDESTATATLKGPSAGAGGLKIRANGTSALGSPSSSKANGDGASSNGGGGEGKKRSVKIQTLAGVSCPTVTSAQMQEVERICAADMGLTDEQMIENGGRGAAMMCLQALGGSRRIQPNNHNAAPIVVILAGNNRTGAYALCAARHLSNHGCVVLAFVAGSNHEGHLNSMVAFQSRGFLATGGEMIHTIAELPQTSSPVDLIMDGMLGYQYTVRDIVDSYERETVCDLMDWANDNKAPVLSLDMPSGVNGTTGQGDKTKFCVRPKWTLCLGAPKAGCRSRSTTGELFLTDLGIPRACWKKVGVKGCGMPWGADFLTGLEYL
ncbi:enhancer of mRNA decapping [Linnemannia gamsii]|uniref:Enhancer of mRNA-decapping protein 3 n=1 Tax=Linnemannia gamsii TaxID=64522 RepID=A0ABQ7K625_9FUNG|nr:enhancer of mRNA decapping [Linnemannia gamsii]